MSRTPTAGHSRRGSSNAAPGGNNPSSTRRQQPGGPTFSPRLPSSTLSTSSSAPRISVPTGAPPAATGPKDVSKLLGCVVELVLSVGEKKVKGTVWCVDTVSGVVVLESPTSNPAGNGKTKDYRLLKMSQIKALNLLSSSPSSSTAGDVKTITAGLKPVSVTGVHAREIKAVSAEDAKKLRMGVGVSRWGQEIFDALAKTLPTRWHQTSIIVLDEIIIHGPLYLPSEMKAGAGSAGRLERVQRVLEGERERLLRGPEGRAWEAEAKKGVV